jgi:putative ABC transport system permease protein
VRFFAFKKTSGSGKIGIHGLFQRSLLKDSLREIRKTFSRFLAILAIVAISIAFYTGIKITCPDMKNTADVYYDDYRLMDFRLLSTVGFNSDDVSAIRNLQLVQGVSPSYSVDAVLDAKDSNSVVRVHSLVSKDKRSGEDYINRPMLVSGRLPEKSGECVIEKSGFIGVNLATGSKISLMSGIEGESLSELKTRIFTVVGVINSPLYVSKDRGTSTIGTGKIATFIFIDESDFDMPVYSTIYLTAKGTLPMNTYSDEYDDYIETVQSALDTFVKERAETRFIEIKTDANKTLAEKENEYNKAVADTNKKLDDAKKTIADNEKKITQGKSSLKTAKNEFEKTIKSSTDKLDQGQAQVDAGMAQYTAKLQEFETNKANAILAGVYEAQKQIFVAAENQLKATKDQLDASYADIASKRAQLETSEMAALKQFVAKGKELASAQAEIVKAKEDLARGRTEANEKLAEGNLEIEKARKQIADIPEVKWHALARNTNAGYVDYGGAADRMNAIAQVFPLIFILVGILICFTAMGRMVDEQRSYMGTVKALGYSKASIAGKYTIYAALASVLGGIIGVFIGFSFFPSFIFKAFSALYTLPKLILTFDTPFAIAAVSVGIAVTVSAALIVCIEELHTSAAQMMRPKAPKPGKIIILERIPFIWKRLKFTQKVTARNILRYKSRFFMTVFGVAGCTALLLVGFALQNSVADIGIKQFTEIYTYQMIVNIKDNASDSEMESINKTIESSPDFAARQLYMSKSVTIGYKDEQKDCGLLVPQDKEKISDFILLHERVSRKNITMTDDGVILTEKLARKIGATVGNEIFIKINEYEKKAVTVTGICETYLNHYMYMSTDLYTHVFKTNPAYNSIYVNYSNITPQNEEAISKKILAQNGVAAVYISRDMLERFKDTITSVNYVVFVLIISAGLLSFIVLYTLTNINISERMREIATIKVLGFYDREVAAYVFKENIILTFLGSAVGLIIGFYLSIFVIQTAEVDVIMFGREIYPLSFILASLMTIIFALFVNIVMLRKIRKINMVEALKTIE